MKKIVFCALISLSVTVSLPAFAACTADTPEEPYVNVCGVHGHKECVRGKVALSRGPDKCTQGKVRNCANATQPTCDAKSNNGKSDEAHENRGN